MMVHRPKLTNQEIDDVCRALYKMALYYENAADVSNALELCLYYDKLEKKVRLLKQ